MSTFSVQPDLPSNTCAQSLSTAEHHCKQALPFYTMPYKVLQMQHSCSKPTPCLDNCLCRQVRRKWMRQQALQHVHLHVMLTSGAAQAKVPTQYRVERNCCCMILARPTSAILAVWSLDRRILADLRSKCTTDRACRKCRPLATSRAMRLPKPGLLAPVFGSLDKAHSRSAMQTVFVCVSHVMVPHVAAGHVQIATLLDNARAAHHGLLSDSFSVVH